LHSWLGVASWCQSVGDVWAPANHLLVLIVVEDSGDLILELASAFVWRCHCFGTPHLLLGV
jgi:hypothetical protein